MCRKSNASIAFANPTDLIKVKFQARLPGQVCELFTCVRLCVYCVHVCNCVYTVHVCILCTCVCVYICVSQVVNFYMTY